MWLVDTNILSEIGRRKPSPKVLTWLRKHPSLSVSVITVEEILMGWYAINNIEKVNIYKELFDSNSYKILPITQSVANHSAYLRGQFRKNGISRSMPDMLIAATAAEHQLTVVTRNVRDFLDCGVPIFDPF